mmetsp:Transcript_8266/g.14983  ORF Transcript_8266/g.14983 Transcript_8266/m.14983 type:complete len:250 (+) Transcript_8266:339-1088(+)
MFRKRCQDMEETHTVGLLLAKTENAPAADANTRIANICNRVKTIFIRSRGDNFGIVLWTCIQVVIVRRQSRLLQLPCLLGIQHAQRTTNLHSHPVHALHHIKNIIECILLITQFSPRGTHAKPSGARLLRPLGRLEDLQRLHGRRRLHEGLVTRALGAIRAIFGTSPRLDREQCALLHLGRVPIHAMDCRCAVHQFVEGEVVNFGDFGFGPIVTDGGGDSSHGTGVFVGIIGIAIEEVVGVADGLLMSG